RAAEQDLPSTGRTLEPPWCLPLLWGEGWGERERGRRIDAAAHYVFGPHETEPQFLAASAILVRSRSSGNPVADKLVLSHQTPAIVSAAV
ncbi:MAG: hypothetical protein WCQ21_36805, partial [Verrucomicrobiota bacterium]